MKGGFQKKMGQEYEVLSSHEADCAACMLRYFGADEDLVMRITRDSYDQNGLFMEDIAESVQSSLNSSRNVRELYGKSTLHVVLYIILVTLKLKNLLDGLIGRNVY